jgi:YfiH family protein
MAVKPDISWVSPDWPAPARVRALTTTRQGGFSSAPYEGLNLGDHVGDDPERVERNRRLLAQRLQLPAPPRWLRQVHGCEVVEVGDAVPACGADAAIATGPGRVCAVLTADCLPLLLCDREGSRVAAVHAGWRGLGDGVIEAAIARLGIPAAEILAWLGPAIGPDAFEVGPEVRQAFVTRGPEAASAFRPGRPGRWLADIYQLARQRLQRQGVRFVYGGEYCTVTDPERFYSYRRDGVTGRMASLIWIQS